MSIPRITEILEQYDGGKSIVAGTALIGKVSIDQATANANEVVTKSGSVVAVNSNAGKSSASVTRPNDATPYGINDVVGGLLTFADVLPASQQFIITAVNQRIDVATVPVGMGGFRLHLYDAEPTAIADNAAFNVAAADRSKYIGYIQLAAPADIGDTLWSQNDGINMNGKLAAASTSLYGILTTDNAYTPSNLAVKTVTIYAVGV